MSLLLTLTYFTPCSSVLIVNFEYVIADGVQGKTNTFLSFIIIQKVFSEDINYNLMLKNKKKQEESDYNISFLPFYAYKFTNKR